MGRAPSVGRQWKRFAVGFDIHGSEQDPRANAAFFKHMDLWKPDVRVCGGDLFDFAPLRKKADADERKQSMREDFEAGKHWLEKFRATHYLRGNHCERLWDLAERGDGVLQDYAVSAIGEVQKLVKGLGCRMLPYDVSTGVLHLGKLKVIHGFVSGVNAARRSALAYGSVLIGHGHGIQHVSIEGIENRMGRMCGCLCKIDPAYARASIARLAWRHGWSFGVVHQQSGLYHVWQAEQVNGIWVVPSDVVQL